MPAGGDIIELVHEQTYLGQTVNNVYHFEAAVADASMLALATWFETNVVDVVKDITSDITTHVNLRLRNLFNEAETLEEPLTGTGFQLSGTNELPSFMAYQVRLDHASGAVRPGFKRLTGVTEGNITDALVVDPVLTHLNTLGGLLVNPPSVANPDWAHVIVGRVCDEPNPVVGATPACLGPYRLPRTQAEATIAYPVEFSVYAQPTTQNTRKWYT